MIGVKRTMVSVLVSLLLVGTAVASVWLMASAGVFAPGEAPLPSAPAASGTLVAAPPGTIAISPGFQVAQPRDPFSPLVTSPASGGTDGTTTTDPNATTTTGGTNSTTTTVAGATTTTSKGDQPTGIRVMLLEVRDQQSGRVAVIEVDGVSYTVKVGDTFATNFKVVSLTTNGGVFTYGDSAFTLAVGQSIIK